MAITLVNHTKLVGFDVAAGTSVNTPVIDTTGANFVYIYYTFYNGGSYPIITDNKGNTYTATGRHNAFSPALACEERFTNSATTGPGHFWTITPWSFYDPLSLNAMSVYVAVFSGLDVGMVNGFAKPWYNDGGNQTTVAAGFQDMNPGSGGGTNGQLIIMGWGNSDPTNNTTITATDGLGGTPAFTIIDSDKAVLPLPTLTNYNAGIAYYIQPVATNTDIKQNWGDWVDLYPHNGPLGQAVMCGAVFTPASSPPPPTPGPGPSGRRAWLADIGPARILRPYFAHGVHFDSNTWLSIPALKNSDSSSFAFFCWFIANSDGGQSIWVSNPSVFRNDVEVQPSGGTTNVFCGLSDATGANILQTAASPALTRNDKWHWMLMSGDTNHAAGLKKFKMYVDGTDVTHINSDTGSAFSVQMNGFPFYLCSDGPPFLSPGDGSIVDLATVWMSPQSLLDVTGTSIPIATRNLFVNSGMAQNPAGFPGGRAAATILFDGDATDFGINQGQGGGAFLTGALTNSQVNPP